MARVLVAEDSPTQQAALQILLEDEDFEVEVAANGREALTSLQAETVDVVLTDLEMPEMNGLELVEAVREHAPAVPVILMTAHGSEEIAAQALRKGAAGYIPKRRLQEEVGDLIRNILSITKVSRHHQKLLECITHIESHFRFGNDPTLIPALIGHFQEILSRMNLWDQTGLYRMSIALQEALDNAMYHGNLEVASELKHDDENAYYELADERRAQSPFRERCVEFSAKVTREEAIFSIKDEGPGFDPRKLPDPTDPENLERCSGRGLLLIRSFMDDVRHNSTGNEITLVKRRDALTNG